MTSQPKDLAPRPECATCGVGELARRGEGCCLDVYEAAYGVTVVFDDPSEWDDPDFGDEPGPWNAWSDSNA